MFSRLALDNNSGPLLHLLQIKHPPADLQGQILLTAVQRDEQLDIIQEILSKSFIPDKIPKVFEALAKAFSKNNTTQKNNMDR